MQTYAAVDLGSNSFHMLVVCRVDGEVRVLDKLRTRVRLAAGLTEEGHIAPEAQKRALACLTQFGHRLSKFEKLHVRVVGTNTLRRDPSGEFLQAAQRALGHRRHDPREDSRGKRTCAVLFEPVWNTCALVRMWPRSDT